MLAIANELSMSAPLVSVIIPHYNDLANLDRCLRSLAAQTLPESRFEVIVADNNSRCGIEEVHRVCGDFALSFRPQLRERPPRATPPSMLRVGATSPSPIRIAGRRGTGCNGALRLCRRPTWSAAG